VRKESVKRLSILGGLAVFALAVQPAASAKDFHPGDVRVCNARRCVAIVNLRVVPQLASFYGRGTQLDRVARPPLRTPYYELRFRSGYVTGIVATGRLDRFLSYGVNLERFRAGVWYRVPKRLAFRLQCLGARLAPLRVTKATLAKSR
jgi:hypothetical protein